MTPGREGTTPSPSLPCCLRVKAVLNLGLNRQRYPRTSRDHPVPSLVGQLRVPRKSEIDTFLQKPSENPTGSRAVMSGPRCVAQGQSAAGIRCKEPGSRTTAAGGPYKDGSTASRPSLLWQTDRQTHIWQVALQESRDGQKQGPRNRMESRGLAGPEDGPN